MSFARIQLLFGTLLERLAEICAPFGAGRYAVAIVLMTLVVKLVLLPLTVKRLCGARELARLQPELTRLRKKYQNDRHRLATEQQELFRREGVHPLTSAC